MNLLDLTALMRSQGITEVQFGPDGQLTKVVVSLAHAPPVIVEIDRRPTLHPDAAEIEQKAFDEEARRAREVEERKAYERIAYAATEGVPLDEDDDEAAQ